MAKPVAVPKLDIDVLRSATSAEYREVALNSQQGFHFHTGRPLAKILGYDDAMVDLVPDKVAVFWEMYRVLKPGGRLQIGDILVEKAVPQAAKEDIEPWTG